MIRFKPNFAWLLCSHISMWIHTINKFQFFAIKCEEIQIVLTSWWLNEEPTTRRQSTAFATPRWHRMERIVATLELLNAYRIVLRPFVQLGTSPRMQEGRTSCHFSSNFRQRTVCQSITKKIWVEGRLNPSEKSNHLSILSTSCSVTLTSRFHLNST